MAPAGDDKGAGLRRAYRLTFAAAVVLAAIGAPLLMQGTVALVTTLTSSQPGTTSPVEGLLLFLLSTVPMALAWFAWRRTQEFQSDMDDPTEP